MTEQTILCSDLSAELEDSITELAHWLWCFDNGLFKDQQTYLQNVLAASRNLVDQYERETL